uniref:Secreted protein n=1 Tax=Peronospora matthiolae TaxID=2874970 RepID=A0AAV1U936_9STRA
MSTFGSGRGAAVCVSVVFFTKTSRLTRFRWECRRHVEKKRGSARASEQVENSRKRLMTNERRALPLSRCRRVETERTEGVYHTRVRVNSCRDWFLTDAVVPSLVLFLFQTQKSDSRGR